MWSGRSLRPSLEAAISCRYCRSAMLKDGGDATITLPFGAVACSAAAVEFGAGIVTGYQKVEEICIFSAPKCTTDVIWIKLLES